MLSLYLRFCQHRCLPRPSESIPIVINSFDNETKGWADVIDVLIHDLLDNGCLSSVVQAAVRKIRRQVL